MLFQDSTITPTESTSNTPQETQASRTEIWHSAAQPEDTKGTQTIAIWQAFQSSSCHQARQKAQSILFPQATITQTGLNRNTLQETQMSAGQQLAMVSTRWKRQEAERKEEHRLRMRKWRIESPESALATPWREKSFWHGVDLSMGWKFCD